MSQRQDAQAGGGDPYADKSVQEMEGEIARTREVLGQDLDALAWHLSPERFKSQAQTSVHRAQGAVVESVQEVSEALTERAKTGGKGLVETLQRHPLPVTLVGLGVAVLAIGGSSDADRSGRGRAAPPEPRYGNPYGSATRADARTGHTAPTQPTPLDVDGEGLYARSRFDSYSAYDSGYDVGYGGATTRPQDDLSGSRHEVPGDASARPKRRTRRSTKGLAGLIERHPVVAGAVTVLAGVAVGLTLPSAPLAGPAPKRAPQPKRTVRVSRKVT